MTSFPFNTSNFALTSARGAAGALAFLTLGG